MKGFYYDTLLDEENICNLDRERELILRGILAGKKLVVYGPRNFGKTSLVRNVIIPRFRKKQKKSFILFVDLMEVKGLEAIHQRVRAGFEKSFADSFPRKNLLEIAKRFLTNLRPKVTIDPLTGEPALSITAEAHKTDLPFTEMFSTIGEKIAAEVPTLIVLDEFQDIAFVPEAQGLFRQAFQELKGIPIVLMGSKRHILSRIFSQPAAPLASFGEDIEFHPIPYEEYHRYILERFSERKLTLSLEGAKDLQDALFRIPEAINIVCAYFQSTFQNKAINQKEIYLAIDRVVESRSSRYEELLSLFSEKEEDVIAQLAKQGTIQHPTSQEFLKMVHASARSVRMIIDRFMNRSLVEKTGEGYRVSDPMLFHFLKKYR